MSDNREEILLITRAMCEDNLVLGTWGNVSVRASDESMWITPSGMNYDNLCAADLVHISFNGTVLAGCWKPSSEWRLHAALYQGRSDCAAIVHTHSTFATAFAVARTAIPPVVEDFVQVVGGRVDVAEYALPGTDRLAQNALVALADRSAVLLASHGLVGVAPNLAEALKVCRVVEKTAQAVLYAKMLGPVEELSEEDIRAMRNFYLHSYGPETCGEDV